MLIRTNPFLSKNKTVILKNIYLKQKTFFNNFLGFDKNYCIEI